MGKQQKIIADNKQRIERWQNDNMPHTFICKELKIAMGAYRKVYPQCYRTHKASAKVILSKKIYESGPTRCKVCEEGLAYSDRGNTFCSNSCAATFNNNNGKYKIHSKEYKMAPKTCKFCDKEIPFNNRHKDFCNINCRKKAYMPNLVKCVICSKEYTLKSRSSRRVTCSKECHRVHQSNNAIKNNLGSMTDHKKSQYNGIWMDSKWEVDIARFLDDNNIMWERDKKHVFWYTGTDDKQHRYYPDFFLPEYNLYLDPKNAFKMRLDEHKLLQVNKVHNINLWVGDKEMIKDSVYNLLLANKTI